MARHVVARLHRAQLWGHPGAFLDGEGTPLTEAATLSRVDDPGRFTAVRRDIHRLLPRVRRRRQEELRVGVPRLRKDGVGGAALIEARLLEADGEGLDPRPGPAGQGGDGGGVDPAAQEDADRVIGLEPTASAGPVSTWWPAYITMMRSAT